MCAVPLGDNTPVSCPQRPRGGYHLGYCFETDLELQSRDISGPSITFTYLSNRFQNLHMGTVMILPRSAHSFKTIGPLRNKFLGKRCLTRLWFEMGLGDILYYNGTQNPEHITVWPPSVGKNRNIVTASIFNWDSGHSDDGHRSRPYSRFVTSSWSRNEDCPQSWMSDWPYMRTLETHGYCGAESASCTRLPSESNELSLGKYLKHWICEAQLHFCQRGPHHGFC